MHLKNEKFNKIITKKNLLIFLLSLIIVSIMVGILFYMSLPLDDKITSQNKILAYFNGELLDNNILINLKKSLSNNILSVLSIWILGISVIGVFFILFLFFMKGFTLGFSITTIFAKFNLKGLLATIFYLFPDKLLSLFLVLYISYHSLCFSYKLLTFLFIDRDINIHIALRKYLKTLVIGLVISIIISIMEVFITPFVLKTFTNFIK
jgi:stage II sporulation protein M